MKFDYVREENSLIFYFNGRLDTATCQEIGSDILQKVSEETEGDEVLEGALRVFFDLAEVDYVASSFLRLCSAVAGKVNRTNLTVRKTSPFVRKVFEMAGFDRIIALE